MRILFLSRWYPYPPNNGSKLRIFGLLQTLASAHQVQLISFYNPEEGKPDLAGLTQVCSDVETVPVKSYRENSPSALAGFFSGTPRYYLDTYSPEMRLAIQRALNYTPVDLVIASQIDMAQYQRFFPRQVALFEEAESGVLYDQFVRARGFLRRLRYGLTWYKYRMFLKRLLQEFNACTVVSEEEARLVAGISPNIRIGVIPNSIDLSQCAQVSGEPELNTLIFSGSMSYDPNFQAVDWFVRHVLPTVRQEVPDAHLTVTGDPAGRSFPQTAGVNLAGYVEDIRSVIKRSWCSVVPIFSGGGTRLKILEAMALGTPVISSSKGAEGLDVKDGVHLLIADDPVSFSQAVIRLLTDPGLRRAIADQAYQLMQEKYDSAVVMPRFLELVEFSAG